jgi:hypothetical protein
MSIMTDDEKVEVLANTEIDKFAFEYLMYRFFWLVRDYQILYFWLIIDLGFHVQAYTNCWCIYLWLVKDFSIRCFDWLINYIQCASLHQIFGALHRYFCAAINSDATLKLTSLHIHLISGSFIFESRRHFTLFSKAGLC